IVVSGNAQDALEARSFTEDVTDYFDKGLGYGALAAFIRGYVQPVPIPGARVLYVEDSKVVALATKRMLERHDLAVKHFVGVEEALEYLEQHRGNDDPGADLVLTDVYLKGELSGNDLLQRVREDFGYGKRRLPVLVMTGDANPDNQSELLRMGANDLVLKPIEERLLVTKTLFQLRVARLPEQRTLDA
ncbi:MAG TPA: response regulator, partial [Lysobacter sp.]|nr:response regulator [Lysobacter sp.]